MAKESGIGFSLNVDDSGGTARDISNDVTNLDIRTPRGVQDATGINSSAMERILLLADMSEDLSGIFNDAANLSHDVFKTVPSSSVTRTVTNAISGQTLEVECIITDYALSRASSGELTYSAPCLMNETTVPTWT